MGGLSVEKVIATQKVTGMTDIDTDSSHIPPGPPAAPERGSDKWPRGALLGAGALALLAVGAAGGAAAWSATRERDAAFDATLVPTTIANLVDSATVGVDGTVAEIYGNKFVVTDGRARALVDTGRAGEDGTLVTVGETVTVQGRFDDGFLHASAIRHADQRIDELAPPPPPHGPGHPPRPGAPFEAH